MSDIDTRLREALSAEDEAFLRRLETERGLFAQLGEVFKGPLAWITWVCNALVLAATAVGIWAIIGFLNADTVPAMLRWAALGWAAWTIQVALKQWLWDRVNTLNVLRELKRIELRVTQLETGV
mgnify:CR=1 FL=1